MTKSLMEVSSMLEDIRKAENLKEFKQNQSKDFCTKHAISGGQLNFLMAVVAVERTSKNFIV